MTSAQLSDLSVQTLHVSSGGVAAQVASLTTQVLTVSLPKYTQVSSLSVQTLHQGSAGARMQAAYEALQVLYTTGAPNSTHQLAWTYDFDGHVHYCLDLGLNGTQVFDVTTKKWYHFDTTGYGGQWNMKNGINWHGGGMVVAGDMVTGEVYKVNPDSYFDEGWRPVVYEVRGVLFASDPRYYSQYSLQLIGSGGQTANSIAPVLAMQYSDDNGITWSDEQTVTLTTDAHQRIQFQSLGAFTFPGRIFRLYDTGGVKFIAYVTAEVDE